MVDFRSDRNSGSGNVATGFLNELEQWAAVDASGSTASLRSGLLGWLRAAQATQPTMALVHQLAARALEVIDAALTRGDAPSAARQALVESCAAERSDLAASEAARSRIALELLPSRRAWIATLSASGAVRDAILAAHAAGREPRVLISESRPRYEARSLAADLGAAGIETWLVVDAAFPLVLSQAHVLWIGADAVLDTGVVNKIGSYAAALAAREHSVPTYALASRRKFLASATRALRILEMPPEEVWEAAPSGVRPRNVYFESVPLPLFRGIVVEDAVLPPGEAAQLARERPLPKELSGG